VREEARAAALARYGIVDTPPEAGFDELVRLAAQVCGTPIAAMSLLDGDRQWFKAEIGLGVTETEIGASFCAQAVEAGTGVFVLSDAAGDARFAGNRLMTGDPGIRFYAGAPLTTPDGVGVGALCIIDRRPRPLSAEQEYALGVLSRQAVSLLEARRATIELAVIATPPRSLGRMTRSVTSPGHSGNGGLLRHSSLQTTGSAPSAPVLELGLGDPHRWRRHRYLGAAQAAPGGRAKILRKRRRHGRPLVTVVASDVVVAPKVRSRSGVTLDG